MFPSLCCHRPGSPAVSFKLVSLFVATAFGSPSLSVTTVLFLFVSDIVTTHHRSTPSFMFLLTCCSRSTLPSIYSVDRHACHVESDHPYMERWARSEQSTFRDEDHNKVSDTIIQADIHGW
ncbi:hypothetical protein L6452_43886 [Arctium lappa]|uniref:Uncharacterized protein n=1 Tax=Arctium lappa TaxID=4217 RepID=A0ACB8XEZ1_ARCLA|nr:hypothetical protein L6452_43886 [Arctium lappa]